MGTVYQTVRTISQIPTRVATDADNDGWPAGQDPDDADATNPGTPLSILTVMVRVIRLITMTITMVFST